MSFRALRRITAEIDDQHRQSMKHIVDDLGEAHFGGDAAQVAARRSFLKRAAQGGAIAFGATLVPVAAMAEAAFAQTTPGSTPGTTTGATTTSGSTGAKDESGLDSGDLAIVLFGQSVELAAVQAYTVALSKGLLTSATEETARVFRRHHAEHAAALATFAPDAVVENPNAKLLAELGPKVQGATTVQALAEVLMDIEDGAAATYQFAMGEIEGWKVAAAAATIEPVEGQHAVAWSTIITPDATAWAEDITTIVPTFQTTSGGFEPSKYAS